MSLPTELQAIVNAQPPEVKANLARRLEAGGNDPGVPLCCKTDSAGNEVCVAVESHSECCSTCSQKFCSHGMTLEDGSVECYDE